MARRHNRRRRRRGSLGPLMRVLSVLLTAVAIVAALTLFFKVDQVVVSGNDRYSEQEIIEVSGVEQGDNLILMDKYRIAEKLYTQLPYITEVRINRKLPDVLMVEVVETKAVAVIKGGSSNWLMDSGGKLLEVIGKLRREIPGITLRTTLIAGFPGETEEQFEDLCNFVKEVQFDRLGCFAYSAEENTVAAKMDGQIEQEVKDKRAELVMQIQTGIMAQKQAAKVGQTVRVICDGIDDESGLYLCRTTGDAPEVDGNVCVSSEEPLYPGQFYDVLVEDSDLYDLYGTVAK